MIINDNKLISHEISLWDISVVQVSLLCQWYLKKSVGSAGVSHAAALKMLWSHITGKTRKMAKAQWLWSRKELWLSRKKRVCLQQNGHNNGVASGVGRCLHFVLYTSGGLPKTQVFLIMSFGTVQKKCHRRIVMLGETGVGRWTFHFQLKLLIIARQKLEGKIYKHRSHI